VCATNRDLIADQDRGTFRRDFYYRIAGWTCSMPSLRDRRGDIPVLAQHFLDELGGKDHLELDQPLTDYLTRREYPGNVRELRQLVVRLSHHHVGKGPITAGALPLDERATAAAIANGNDSDSMTPSDGTLSDAVEQAVSRGVGLKELVAQTRDAAISAALDAEGGNVRAASRRLGVTDRAIHMHRAAHRNGQ
jgi:transcriptional regulator with GAF, ATPase, and Fis domain